MQVSAKSLNFVDANNTRPKVIRDYHKRAFHAGVSQTLAQVRTKCWISRGRSQVKRELNQYTICQRAEVHTFKMPKMPPWPKE